MRDIPTQLQLPFDEHLCINTLRGKVSLHSLGRVLVHEHVFCRVRPQYFPDAKDYILNQFNHLLNHGVGTIIDVTTYVLPDQYLDFLQDHPMNVVCCAGYYLKSKVPSAYHKLDAVGLTDKLRQKVEFGIGKNHIKPGVLKIASSGRQLTKFEKNALNAVGIVQKESKLPVITHACRGARKQVEILLAAGANPNQIVISHMEMELKGVQPLSFEQLLQDMLWILGMGVCVFFGDFTVQPTVYRDNLIRLIRECYAQGYANQIFLSTDSYWMHRAGQIQVRGSNRNARILRNYEYVFTLIVPLLLQNGFSKNDVDLFLKENPLRIFRTS
jgi:phosphotriesterase-related protein